MEKSLKLKKKDKEKDYGVSHNSAEERENWRF
ncbi:hypothetical protein ES703_122247 [subsurface metagenome]